MRIFCVFALLCGLVSADSPIDSTEILKNNPFFVDKNNANYVFEITQDGEIVKRFLNDSSLCLPNLEQNNSANIAQSPAPSDEANKHHIKEWDKSKIIYEQVVDKIDILR